MRIAVQRTVLLLLAAIELFRAVLFLGQYRIAYNLIGRELIDPVIGRQYGLFLLPVAVLYIVLALDPARYRRMLWVGVIQRGAELLLAVSDWATRAISAPTFVTLLVIEIVFGGVLLAFCWQARAVPDASSHLQRRGMRRVLLGFGGLFLFWAVASSVLVPVGAWLLNYPTSDLYTTKQQGIGFLVLSMTSLFAAADVERYRLFIWVPISSQVFGVLNALYEVSVGTIPFQAALVQWSIQAIIISAFVWFYPWKLTARAANLPLDVSLPQPLP